MQERVQKIISQWGIASRRQAEQMILEGRVRLNGSIVELGQKANTRRDRIEVDGKLIRPSNRPDFMYLLLNKPKGVISTCYDPKKRLTVLDLLPKELQKGQGLHPIGRLDVESTGAILLTNDGELTHQLTHPSHHVSKTYLVWVEGEPSEGVLQQWRKGVMLDGRKTLPAIVTLMKRTGSRTLLKVVLREGRNRQIRRVAEQLGYPVQSLHRSAIGSVSLNRGSQSLALGQYRPLEPFEIRSLKHRRNLDERDFSERDFKESDLTVVT